MKDGTNLRTFWGSSWLNFTIFFKKISLATSINLENFKIFINMDKKNKIVLTNLNYLILHYSPALKE
jgi:hypothetical protein